MFFCILPDDEKTFDYFKRYQQDIIDKSPTKTYNDIQADDIKDHLRRMGLPESSFEEEFKWIKKNAKGMRIYLNTITIASVIWMGSGKNWNDITYPDFEKIRKNINKIEKTGILEKMMSGIKEE